MTKGRPRSTKTLPPQIKDATKLPKGVWYHKKGNGRFMLQYWDQAAWKWRSKRLCSASASMNEIWQAYEAESEQNETTFKSLSLEFQQTSIWRGLSSLTQKDYVNCHNAICKTETTQGEFGDTPITAWKKSTILKYRDKRGDVSPTRANKELSYIKRLFAWAFEYDKVTDNISAGISKLKTSPRQHYAENKDYEFLLQVAKDSPYWYLPFAFTIAYQAKMRLSEVLDLTDAAELPEGLYIARRKGSKDSIMLWTESTKAAWDEAKAYRNKILESKRIPHPIDPKRRFIFVSDRTGDRITASGFESAKKRIDALAKAKAERLGIEYTHFTFHDVKRRGITDHQGNTSDKMDASGHKSLAMMNVYNVKPTKVKPTKE